MKYLKPTSLTWWASATPLVAGLLVAAEPLHGLFGVVQTINAVTGNIPAAALINAGLAGIGIRAALK